MATATPTALAMLERARERGLLQGGEIFVGHTPGRNFMNYEPLIP